MHVHIKYPDCREPRPLKARTYSLSKDVIKRICILLKEETGSTIYDNKDQWGLYTMDGRQILPNSTVGSYGVKAGSLLVLKQIETPCASVLDRHTEVAPTLMYPIFTNHRA